MSSEGQYIYAIVATHEEKGFGPIGIGDRNDEVYTVCYQDIGAVISPSSVVKYPVTRANTMAHQKVMEEVMKYYPMLPVRFGTIGEGIELIKEKVLQARYDEFKDSLRYVEDKVELGLKALWMNMEVIFREIVEEKREIRVLKERLISRSIKAQQDMLRFRLGEMVKKALDTKRMQEEKAILSFFKGLWVEHKTNNIFGDQMVTNNAFLVQKDREKAFDEMVDQVTARHDGRIRFKYVGPVPPCNFVEIVVK
ncbi:MAG: GvpL/GvpF family gas vesicle protein, partial [Deltaproteobacteria bacterium]|nr:GvpL/GvpF family gas vesicle protein [Deltaproteobacteria bacterium]